MRKSRLSKLYIIKIIFIRLIFVLLLNFIYISLNFLIPENLNQILLIIMKIIDYIAIIVIFILPLIEYFAYRYEITEEYIEINYGVIFRNYVYMPMEHLKYAVIIRDPLDYLLGISRVNVYSPAKKRTVKGLKYNRAKEICQLIRKKSLENEK
ncbi:MAG: PH domain-containing protein [Sarcina sp.]